MKDIERVEPAAGAQVVDFDYEAASTVLGTLGAAVASLGEHATGLVAARNAAVVSWEGAYRDEFERAHRLLHRRFVDAVEVMQSASRTVYRSIDGANERQRVYNAAHEASLHAAP